MTIIQGCALDILPTLRAGSVHTVVTSPPYWGLRDYGIAPSIWGGGDPECSHSWVSEWRYREGGNAVSSAAAFSAAGPENAQRLKDTRWRESTWCARCGAWRGCLGLEPSLSDYITHLVEIFRRLRRVLRDDGTVWLNLGDAYAGSWGNYHPTGAGDQCFSRADPFKPKDLLLMPHRVAIALQEDGWWVRQDIVWSKPNCVPESVTDRPTRAHEYVFLLTKSRRYYYDAEAVREPRQAPHARGSGSRFDLGVMPTPHKKLKAGPLEGAHGTMAHDGNGRRYDSVYSSAGARNLRSVWVIPPEGYSGAHYATFPERLVEPCILAGTSARGCCPRCGAPWARVIDVDYANPGNRTTNGPRSKERRYETVGFGVRLERQGMTTGWQPSCDCPADSESVPCTVLDPFAGSGTVGAVAHRLGRAGIGIELNPEYCRLAEKRIASVPLPLPFHEALTSEPEMLNRSLFDVEEETA